MMASVSDNIRNLTGVFTTPSPNYDNPASFNWLPDADALGRLCHILCAIAVILVKPRRNQTEAAPVAGLVHPQPRASFLPVFATLRLRTRGRGRDDVSGRAEEALTYFERALL
jgi:hypothetical protein